MKHFLLLLTLCLGACSTWQPYKDQNLEFLQHIQQDPKSYQNAIVSFTGEVQGFTQTTNEIRLVLKTDVPFYYYATGRGNSLSYELILVVYPKTNPQMFSIHKQDTVKILARVDQYEKRKNRLGYEIGVLHLKAFALSNRTKKADIFHATSPEKQLYESWKKGKLFYKETPEQIVALYPAPVSPKTTIKNQPSKTAQAVSKDIVYDEAEEDFILDP